MGSCEEGEGRSGEVHAGRHMKGRRGDGEQACIVSIMCDALTEGESCWSSLELDSSVTEGNGEGGK